MNLVFHLLFVGYYFYYYCFARFPIISVIMIIIMFYRMSSKAHNLNALGRQYYATIEYKF